MFTDTAARSKIESLERQLRETNTLLQRSAVNKPPRPLAEQAEMLLCIVKRVNGAVPIPGAGGAVNLATVTYDLLPVRSDEASLIPAIVPTWGRPWMIRVGEPAPPVATGFPARVGDEAVVWRFPGGVTRAMVQEYLAMGERCG